MRHIWGRRFSGATLVYLFTRYTALAHQVLFVTLALLVDSSDQVNQQLPSLLHVELITLASLPQDVQQNLARGRPADNAEYSLYLLCVCLL